MLGSGYDVAQHGAELCALLIVLEAAFAGVLLRAALRQPSQLRAWSLHADLAYYHHV